MTNSRHRKTPTSAVNHRTKSPKSPENTITTTTKTISKSPESHRAVFTENDEIDLLKTLSKSQNMSFTGSNTSRNFTEKQIAKKMKRLKEKYHKLARSKSLIKTPHDGEIYEIGRKIWGRDAPKDKDNKVIEVEDVNLEDFPFLVNEMTTVFRRNEYCKEGLSRLGKKKLNEMNEKWMQLKLEESELMMNKAQLYHEYLKFVVEGSKGSSTN